MNAFMLTALVHRFVSVFDAETTLDIMPYLVVVQKLPARHQHAVEEVSLPKVLIMTRNVNNRRIKFFPDDTTLLHIIISN